MPHTEDRMRILLITRNLPPLVGGMERLLLNVVTGLAQYADLTVIGPEGCSRHLPGEITVYETPSSPYIFMVRALFMAARLSRQGNYSLVLGGSGLVAPVLSAVKRLSGGRTNTVLLVHGLDLVVENTIYQSGFLPLIRRMDQLIANSENTRKIAIDKKVPADRIQVINPGTSLPDIDSVMKPAMFLKKHNISFDYIVLFVGRMTRRKGLSGFIRNSLPAILHAEQDACLLVVGDNPNNAINKQGEQAEVALLASTMEYSDRIIFLDYLEDSELEAAYAAADVQVFPLQEVAGDVEGFGMLAIEAAACGTPTIPFASGGVSDEISSDSGRLLAAGDYTQFAQCVI